MGAALLGAAPTRRQSCACCGPCARRTNGCTIRLNREEAVAILAGRTKGRAQRSADAYTVLVQQGRAFSTQGEIPDEAMQAPIDFLVGRSEIVPPLPAPGKYIDRSYLEKVGA